MLAWSAAPSPDATAGLSSADDATLIAEYLRTDDEQIFEILVGRYKAKVFRLATSLLGPQLESEAEDATQEVFVAVLRQMRTFRRESTFSTWLYRVARNKIIDYGRRAARRPSQASDELLDTAADHDALADPEGALSAVQRQERLLRCVDRLNGSQRAVIRLHYWHGQSVGEISELLGLSPGTIRSHLFRARQRLATFLQEDGFHE
jgi:RNA polymerase sigma factor (sigma-70 family)